MGAKTSERDSGGGDFDLNRASGLANQFLTGPSPPSLNASSTNLQMILHDIRITQNSLTNDNDDSSSTKDGRKDKQDFTRPNNLPIEESNNCSMPAENDRR